MREDSAYALIGSEVDADVRRNLGKPGAIEGPNAIRRALRILPEHPPATVTLFDVGNIYLETSAGERQLRRAQEALAKAVEVVQSQGLFSIVLGGGNGLSFGHWLGIHRFLEMSSPSQKLGIINFDAHFDLRPLNERGISSGTPYSQVAEYSRRHDIPFQYLCIGIQRAGNTQFLFDRAMQLGALHLLADQFLEEYKFDMLTTIHRFLHGLDAVYLSVDLDVFTSGSAPGVSAVNPDGITPGPLFYALFDQIVGTGKVVGFDVAEMSPPHDAQDGRTARLAARLIQRLIYTRAEALKRAPLT